MAETAWEARAESGPLNDVELAIGGMTCASCASRIERKLNKLDGVTATVNYATEKAKVSFPAAYAPTDLVAVVEAAGYTAVLPEPPAPAGPATADGRAAPNGRRAGGRTPRGLAAPAPDDRGRAVRAGGPAWR